MPRTGNPATGWPVWVQTCRFPSTSPTETSGVPLRSRSATSGAPVRRAPYTVPGIPPVV